MIQEFVRQVTPMPETGNAPIAVLHADPRGTMVEYFDNNLPAAYLQLPASGLRVINEAVAK